MIISNRLPYEYFITTGKGESDAGSKGLPFETGSYDAALNDAGIEDANMMVYTSVIPTEAKEISKEEGLSRIKWGQVIESIKAQGNGRKGERITAAVMITSVHDPNGKYLGGFACEYSGSGDKKAAADSLLVSVRGMIQRRGYGTMPADRAVGRDCTTSSGYVIHPGKRFVVDTLDVKKKAGSVLAAICFMSFRVEDLSKSSAAKRKTIGRKTKKGNRSTKRRGRK